MPRIPPYDGPFDDYFRFRQRFHQGPFQRGLEPQAVQEEQWTESIDREARLQRSMPSSEGVPDLELLLNLSIGNLAALGMETREICALYGISRQRVRKALTWYRGAPEPGGDSPGSSIDITL